jgi:hypothetical protein
LDTAAIAYGIPTKPHGMNEFYGRSAGGPPPPPTPPPPPPPPPPIYYYHFIEPCAGGSPTYIVRHTSFIDVNKAVTLFGPGGCWKVTGVSGTSFNYVVQTVYADCGTCVGSPPPPPPAALSITNGSVTCFGDGQFISTLSGGTGAYDYVAIDSSPANVSNAVNGISGTRVTPSGGSSHQWLSLANGTYYTAVKDSAGSVAVQASGVVVNCAAPPPPPPPPVIYTYISLCGTGGAVSGYITGNFAPGTNLEDTTTNECYIATSTTTSPTGTLMPNSFTANTCTCPSPPPPPPPPPTPPSVTVFFTTGCSGGQTFVNLTASTANQITTPSYSWLVTLDSGTDFSNPANYISPQNNSGLANGSYYVAAYDNANGDYDVSCCTANQGCSPPPPPPPGPSYYYNNAYRNSCNGASPCNDDGVEVVLRSTVPLSNGSWYSDGSKSYQPYGSTSGPSYGVDIDPYIYTEAGNCETACNNF